MLRAYKRGNEIRVRKDACLEYAGHANICDRCVPTCPEAAIKLHRGPEVSNECIGCGRCAAVCPTGALQVDFVVASRSKSWSQSAVTVGCHRLGKTHGVEPNIMVRCLGALPASTWLTICTEAHPRPVEIFDAGACRDCPAGGVAEPWSETLARAEQLLANDGLPHSRFPRVVRVARAEPDDTPDFARRRLLPLFAMDRTRVKIESDRSVSPSRKPAAIEIVRQERALGAVASVTGIDSERSALAAATATSACKMCGVCASVCPTPALTIADSDGGERCLSFEGRQCVACRACERVCPERAITISSTGGSGAKIAIRAMPLKKCAACGEDFASDAEQQLCATCQRTAGLGANGLFASRGDAWRLVGTISTGE